MADTNTEGTRNTPAAATDEAAAPNLHEDMAARSAQLDTSTLLATAGGFLDAFTYFGHGHVFANAMTGNVVLLGVEAVSAGGWGPSLRHLPPILMFLLGIWGARALELGAKRRILPGPHPCVLLVEIATMAVIACLPAGAGNFWITSAIAFVASMQVQTFRNVDGYSYNSTFTTGNLRMLSVGLFDWCFDLGQKDAPKSTRVFATICLGFLVGATTGGLTVKHFGNRALLIELALLGIALARVLQLGIPGRHPVRDSGQG